MNSSIHAIAAYQRRHAPIKQLVENRTLYEQHEVSLSVYDTYAQAERVQLQADELLYCGMISGKKIMHDHVDGARLFLPHESFVIRAGEVVEIDFPEATLEQPTTCLALSISEKRLRQVCDQLEQDWAALPTDQQMLQPSAFLHIAHGAATQRLLTRIVESFVSHDEDRDLVLKFGMTELLTRMLRQQGRQFLLSCTRLDPTAHAFNAVLHFIDQHLAQPIGIEQLCRVACMSRSKLYELFARVVGCGAMEYVQQRRLERAREWIAAGRSITEVCYAVGYVNPSHFARRFHQQYGMSPKAYAAVQGIRE